MKILMTPAVLALGIALSSCSSGEADRRADCAAIMAALRTPADMRRTDASWSPMWERAAATLRTARSQLRSKELKAAADAMIKELDAMAKDTASDAEAPYRVLGEPYYKAEHEITKVCGPLHPSPSA